MPQPSDVKTVGVLFKGDPIALLRDGSPWTWKDSGIPDTDVSMTVTSHPQTPTRIDLGINDITEVFNTRSSGLGALYVSDRSYMLWRCEDYRVFACVAVDGVKNVTQMVGGQVELTSERGWAYTVTALTQDGTVYRWDEDDANGFLKTVTPVMVKGVHDATALDVSVDSDSGEETGYVSASDGSVHAWGDDGHGRRGDGDAEHPADRNTATVVPGLDHVSAIGTGDGYVYALKDDGTAWSWGDNYGGVLGGGTTDSRDAPVLIGGTDVVQ